jgi:hypothetical protein
VIGRRRRERHERELAELDAYEDAKAALVRSESSADVTGVTRTLADGRFHHACVPAPTLLLRPRPRTCHA